MKILHISTSVLGGAGKAALRLHLGLVKSGIDSKLLFLYGNEIYNNTFKYPPLRQSIISRILKKLGINVLNTFKNQKTLDCYSNLNFETFTFPNTDYKLHEHPLVKAADIINLHWIASFIDYPSFFKNISKPIVWTLHDMNPFFGGFHYEGDLLRNRETMGELENKLKSIKYKALQKNLSLSIATPSIWLKSCSEKSNTLKNRKHYHIPYGIEANIYRPLNKEFCKNLLGIPTKSKVILFVAESLDNIRKGFNVLLEALPSLGNNFTFVSVGKKWQNYDRSILFIDKIEDERLMPCAYNSADIFVIPTMEDNLPNTILESLACGTPVIGSNVGGVPDMVRDGITGMLFETGNPKDLADKIEKFFALSDDERKKMSENCRRIAVEEYSHVVQAKAYIKLYEEILTTNKTKGDEGRQILNW